MIEVKAATEGMLAEFFKLEELVPEFCAALMVFENGQMVALGGLFYSDDEAVLFANAPEGWIAKHPIISTKIAKTLLAFAEYNEMKVISFAAEEVEKAGAYLEHFGFVKNGDRYERS